jgi:N-acetyl-gamma-glutamyl-phosphate reductase
LTAVINIASFCMFMHHESDNIHSEPGETATLSRPRSVAIVGATGYAGQEIRRLLAQHPGFAEPLLLTARAGATPQDTASVGATNPASGGVLPFAPERLTGRDAVFLCTPHGAAQPLVVAALEQGCRVVDLSADFRLKDPATYQTAYGEPHQVPGLLETAVYGLTEHRREEVSEARLVANPGCYPTSILLPLIPLLEAGVIDSSAHIVADCKSGVSGAGNSPSPRTTFGAVHENFSAYSVGGHRHLPEIRQEAGFDRIVFVPHLLPVFRGILSTIYVRPPGGATANDLRDVLRARYGSEPFVRILEEDAGVPTLADVRMTNRCHVAVTGQGELAVITSAIDNLMKGAAGQALQNMNLMLGFPETAGLA